MDRKNKFSWRARARSFKYAAQGIATLLREEHNARIHLAAAIAAITLGIICRISPAQWCVIVTLIGAVIALEAVNTAIEAIADKVSTQHHDLIKKAKDTAAAAVLIMALAALTVGCIIFIPPIIHLF